MAYPMQMGKRTRMCFARIEEALAVPDLIEVQKKSYEYFLKEGNIDLNMEYCTMEPPAEDYVWEKPGLKKWGKLVAAMPGDIQKMGVQGYAKEHPGVVVLAAAALAHVVYYRGIIPKKRK